MTSAPLIVIPQVLTALPDKIVLMMSNTNLSRYSDFIGADLHAYYSAASWKRTRVLAFSAGVCAGVMTAFVMSDKTAQPFIGPLDYAKHTVVDFVTDALPVFGTKLLAAGECGWAKAVAWICAQEPIYFTLSVVMIILLTELCLNILALAFRSLRWSMA